MDRVAVKRVIGKMKNRKAAGSSSIVGEMLKASGDVGVRLVTRLLNAVIKEDRIPDDCCCCFNPWLMSS